MHVDFAREPLQLENIRAGADAAERLQRLVPHEPQQDGLFLFLVRRFHRDAHQEAVELGLRQRVSAERLDRVLRRDDEERRLELHRFAVYGDLPLAHALEQAGLRARRGAVDLVGQQDVAEGRTGAEDELVFLLIKIVEAGHVAGQQVRRKLDAAEPGRNGLGERLGEHGLAHAGHVFDQNVAVGDHGGQEQVDDRGRADHDAADIFLDGGNTFGCFHENFPCPCASGTILSVQISGAVRVCAAEKGLCPPICVPTAQNIFQCAPVSMKLYNVCLRFARAMRKNPAGVDSGFSVW